MKRELAALAAREWDVLVVGGGIHGAAVAWDAAQRGLKAALVEREDFGAGASWNSLKTIHGGMRHLQRLDVAGLRESARERRALLGLAPALVAPMRFLVPCTGYAAHGRAAFAAGLLLNDALTPDRNRGLPPAQWIPAGRTLSAEEALALVPGLPRSGLTGAAVWHDAQVSSSERLLLGFVHAAADAGASVANHVEVQELLRAGGRVVGAALRDGTTGRTLEARARLVVNAAGPWVDEVGRPAGPRPATPLLRARNLVLRRPLGVPLAVGARSGGRFLFVVPWQGRSIVGTSYEPAQAPASDPLAFLDEAALAFPWARIERADLALVHEGLVPGDPGPGGPWTRSRVVDHARKGGLGLVSLRTAKYTTARAVAERAVDLALERLGRPRVACRTATTPLPKARPLEGPLDERARAAVRDEMALSLADAVLRRLDLGPGGAPPAAELAVVSGAMARELGWDAARVAAERASLAAFFASRGAVSLLE